jgi:hypothetical protein
VRRSFLWGVVSSGGWVVENSGAWVVLGADMWGVCGGLWSGSVSGEGLDRRLVILSHRVWVAMEVAGECVWWACARWGMNHLGKLKLKLKCLFPIVPTTVFREEAGSCLED